MNDLILSSLKVASGKGSMTNMEATAGTDIADSTAALAMDATYLNKVTFSALDGAAKTVTLPAFTHTGDTVIIIQKVDLVGSGVLTIDCAGSQSFDTGSYAKYHGASNVNKMDIATAGETSLVITGAATNSGAGIGTTVKATYLGSDKILIEAQGVNLGNGSDAFAFAA